MSSPLHREVEEDRLVRQWVRDQLYGVTEGGWRSRAVTAVAAAAAEDTYRYGDQLPELWNETSNVWRIHLAHVWQFLEGDAGQHYYLSRAIAEYLVSPLNHNEGQDGPDDFDRPWTVASYSAVSSVVMGGVDFAITAVAQLSECIDLKYDGEFNGARRAEFSDHQNRVRYKVSRVVSAEGMGRPGLTPNLLAELRS